MNTDNIKYGRFTNISPNAQITVAEGCTVSIGDYCNIGSDVKIIANGGNVVIDDWTSIHDRCLLLAGKDCFIGQHCWFGQSAVIDATGGLSIGNSVRVGMFSQIWSHVGAGELYDGCTLNSKKHVVIQDNAWLVGTCYVGSGVIIGRYSTCMLGSNITKDVPAFSVCMGSPAKVREKLSFYKDIPILDKVEMIKMWAKQYDVSWHIIEDVKMVQILNSDSDVLFHIFKTDHFDEVNFNSNNFTTFISLKDKAYVKSYSEHERGWFKYLSDNKVRFLEYRS